MTAFLFIPATVDATRGRHLDFAGMANLFAEAEEPPRRRQRGLARTAAMILLAIVAIGDAVLVARPNALTAGLGRSVPVSVPLRHLS